MRTIFPESIVKPRKVSKEYCCKTNNNRDKIIEWLSAKVPRHIIAKRIGIHEFALREYIKQKGLMKAVLARMSREMPKDGKKYISTQEALKRAQECGITTTLATMHAWIKRSNLGFQPGGAGSWYFIDEEKFEAFINGKGELTNGEKSA